MSTRRGGRFRGVVRTAPTICPPHPRGLFQGQCHPLVFAALNRVRKPFLEPMTQAERQTCVSATDFNTLVHKLSICGENKYRSMKKLVRKKMGLEAKIDSPACDHGIFYEPEALRVYQEVTGNILMSNEIGWCKGPVPGHDQSDYIMPDFVGCTPDGICRDVPVLVEIKCPFWKRSVDGGIPDIYWPQIQCQMAVTGIHRIHFVRYIPPSLTEIGLIDILEATFDRAWWSVAVSAAMGFQKHMAAVLSGVAEIPPPPRKRQKKAPVNDKEPVICHIILDES